MRSLDVFFDGVLAGRLSEVAGGYSFVYAPEYRLADMPSLSVLLPRQEGEFHSDILFPFFVNILPEGGNRRIICRKYKIDENDDFGLLYSMAGVDFIGNVSFETV